MGEFGGDGGTLGWLDDDAFEACGDGGLKVSEDHDAAIVEKESWDVAWGGAILVAAVVVALASGGGTGAAVGEVNTEEGSGGLLFDGGENAIHLLGGVEGP